MEDSPFFRKGAPLPTSLTREFNAEPANVSQGRSACGQSTVRDWFDGRADILLVGEILGLGSYGDTLAFLPSDELSRGPDEEENAELLESWMPRFAYDR